MATQDKQRDDVAQTEEATRAENATKDKSDGAANPAPEKATHGGSTGRREFGCDG